MNARPTVRRARPPKGKTKRRLGVILVTMGVLIAMAGVGVWSVFYSPETPIPPGRSVPITIEMGSSTASIGRTLAEAGVSVNANMFRLRSRLAEVDGQMKAGDYTFTTGMDYQAVFDKLTTGPQKAFTTVTIPEGFVIEQIAQRFEEQAGIPAEEFLALAQDGAPEFAQAHPYLEGAFGDSLEGFLFPKTYRVPEGATARDVISMMLRQFDKEIASIDMSPAEQRGQSLEEIVIIASIIEREASVPRERPKVASVIYNRLAKNMRLEIDATVEYVLPGNRFRLRYSDLEIDSPFNTYRNFGITPGPIANPGLASIEAAVRPADTEYIYYVLTSPDGSHTFTRTWAEHQAAREVSREVFGR